MGIKNKTKRVKAHIIRIRDKVQTIEGSSKAGLRGVVTFGIGKYFVPFIDPFGKMSYVTKFKKELFSDENIVPIGGYQFAFDKLFNIGLDQETTLRVGDLNDEAPQMKIGIPRSEYISADYNAEVSLTNGSRVPNPGVRISALNYVFGFMIGDGASREDNTSVIVPDYKRRNLYNAIPFRMSNDGYPMENGKYFGATKSYQSTANIEPVSSYYVKKFDNPAPRIVHMWASDNNDEMSVVDDTVFASTSSRQIESFVEINLSVGRYDGRGYYTSTATTPRVNEFALVSGWFNAAKGDYESLRMFTHFSRPSISLDENDSIEAIYRLYAR